MAHTCTRCTRIADRRVAQANHMDGWYGHTVVGVHTCHGTHAGIVFVRDRLGKDHAFFYLPGRSDRPFATQPLSSAHAKLESIQSLANRIGDYKKVCYGPHTLAVGDLLTADKRGVGLPSTHIVVAVPTPRHVDLVRCPHAIVESGWEGTTEVPRRPTQDWIDRQHPTRHIVTMPHGVPSVRLAHGWVARPWDGQPYHRSNDS